MSHFRCCFHWSLLTVMAAVLAGCQTPTPDPGLAEAIAVTTGVAEAVTFETDAEPDAPAPPDGGLLTESEAIRLAVLSSPRLREAVARVRLAQAEADQARLLPNPVLSLAVRLPEAGGQAIVEAGIAADLLSLLQRPGRITAADHRLRAAAAEALTTALDVVADVQQQYRDAQTLQSLLPLLEDRQNLLNQLVDLAQARLDAGEGTRLDVTTLRAQAAQNRLDINQRQIELREVQLALARLLGEPTAGANWRLPPLPALSPLQRPEDAWLSAALTHRAELQAIHWELAALGAERDLTRWAPWEDASGGIDAEREDVWSVGPAVSTPLPIFDWGQAKRAAAEARITEAKHRLTRRRQDIVFEVRRAYTRYEELNRSLLTLREELLPLLRQQREDAEAAFRAGRTDVVPLILAEQATYAALADELELSRRAALVQVQLQRAVGGSAAAPNDGTPLTP